MSLNRFLLLNLFFNFFEVLSSFSASYPFELH